MSKDSKISLSKQELDSYLSEIGVESSKEQKEAIDTIVSDICIDPSEESKTESPSPRPQELPIEQNQTVESPRKNFRALLFLTLSIFLFFTGYTVGSVTGSYRGYQKVDQELTAIKEVLDRLNPQSAPSEIIAPLVPPKEVIR